MVSHNYDILTIKTLYSLSGNLCAFPECKQELITTENINVSDICHIEGGEENSPRYNPKLSPKQLDDYENLILMCKTHHKVIDTNVSKYTVAYLKQIKQEHEQRNRSREFSISNEVAQQIIDEQMTQFNINAGTGSQNVTQTGDINIHYGITSISETKNLIEELFKENFPRLESKAREAAEESIANYNKVFFERAKGILSESDIKKFEDPDIQYVLTNSIIRAARRNEPELHENLAYLLVERIQNSEDDLRKIVYNEAIDTIGKLTRDGLKIITLCFILRYAIWQGVSSYDHLNQLIRDNISSLLDFKNTLAEFQHIEYTGCGKIGAAEWSYVDTILEQYGNLESLNIEESQLKFLRFPEIVISELFSKVDDVNYKFNMSDENTLEEYLSKIELQEIIKNNIRAAFRGSLHQSRTRIASKIQEFEMIQSIVNLVNGTDLKNMTLTSVGIVVGAMYYERLTGTKIDISIWIN